jgi:hypothetical protein
VNTFYYYIGGGHDDFRGLGVDRIVRYGKLFGLGSQTGVDLSGELNATVVTEVVSFKDFYRAEEYHQKYLAKHLGGYSCHFMRKSALGEI